MPSDYYNIQVEQRSMHYFGVIWRRSSPVHSA